MAPREISKLLFTSVYPLYVQKAQRKNRTQEEVDAVIGWLTGYSRADLARFSAEPIDFQTFFDRAPALNPARARITGSVCGVRVEDIQDPMTQNIRYLDKLVDELAKGRPLARILRTAEGG